jgi:hypothetical protein
MTTFETSQYARVLANNKAQSAEIKRLRTDLKMMCGHNQELAKECTQLESENELLKHYIARLEGLQGLLRAWRI